MANYENAAYATMPITGSPLGYASAEANSQKPTFMDPLGSAHSNLSELLSRLEVVTQRLCGAQPPEPSQGDIANKLQSVPSGLFDELTARGNDMCRKLSRAHDLLNRIERALP